MSFSGDFSGDVRNNSFVGEEASLVGEEARRGLTRSRHAWSRASRFYLVRKAPSVGLKYFDAGDHIVHDFHGGGLSGFTCPAYVTCNRHSLSAASSDTSPGSCPADSAEAHDTRWFRWTNAL